jgi:hypothetical protein
VREAFTHVRTTALLLVAFGATMLAGALYVRYGSDYLNRLAAPDLDPHADFETFWLSTRAVWDGADLYATDAELVNLNPPLVSFLLAPLGLLDPMVGYRALVLLTLVMIIGSMVVVARELRLGAGPAMLAIAALLVSTPMLGTLGLGQIYGLLVVGLTVGWLADRRGHPIAAGVALGLVVAIKPSLALLLLFPVVRRQWWTLTAALLAGWFATLLGWLATGGGSFPRWLAVVAAEPLSTYFDNASLPATVARLFSATEWGRPLLELPGTMVIGYLVAAAVLAVTLWRVRRASEPDTGLWACTAAALLASPIAWHNYLLLLAPAVLLLIALRRWPVVLLLLALPLIGGEWTRLWFVDGSASALPLSLWCGVLLAYWLALLPPASPRRSRRTSLSPDQTSSTAQTLTSTQPSGKACARTPSSVRSVDTPEDRFGQAIQSAPRSAVRAAAAGQRRRSSPESGQNTSSTS